MDNSIVQTLTVPFAAGFVVQRFVEILDTYTTAKIADFKNKKFVIGVISLVLGIALAAALQLRMFHQLLQLNCDDIWMTWLDYFATGIFISGGSEGFNSLLKFANYKKEASKAIAANELTAAGKAVQQVNPQN
jgi:predicted Na+-dependent transporter